MSFGDDVSYFRVSQSIATQASVAVPPDTPGSMRGIDGRYYSIFAIGQSVLGVPFYLMGAFAKHYSDPHLRDVNPAADPITYFACLLGILSASGAVVLFYLSCVELGLSHTTLRIMHIRQNFCFAFNFPHYWCHSSFSVVGYISFVKEEVIKPNKMGQQLPPHLQIGIQKNKFSIRHPMIGNSR